MHNQNKEGVDLDVLLNQAGTTARLGSEKHCRDLLLEIEKLDLARRAEPSVAAGDVCALDKTIVEPSKFVLGFWIDDGRIEFAKGDFSTLKDGAYNIVTAPVLASPAVSQKDGAAVYQVAVDTNGGIWKDVTAVEYEACTGRNKRTIGASPAVTTASASIDNDPEFQRLAEAWRAEPYGTRTFLTTWDALVAFIDSRAQAPSRDAAALDESTIWEAYGKNHARTARNCGSYVMYERGFKDGAALANSGASHAANAGEDDKHLPGWERGIATVTMTGHQLREALDFLNPGGDDEPDERDDELTFGIVQVSDDVGNVSAGLCCWNDDSDGVLPLDRYPNDRAAVASSAEQEAK